MELVNTHAHTEFCGHGEGTVDELVQAARAAGITTLAVTEHYPLTPAFDPKAYLAMPQESVRPYLEALEAARAAYPDIEILLGTEFELWCDAVTSTRPFTVMSHPDLAKKFGHYPSYDVGPLYRQAAEAAASAGRMVEVNTSGSYYACKEMFPAPALLAEFCRAGVPCTVGTDAHTPANVARDIEAGYRLMAQAGYRTVTVPTRDGDRRSITSA